MSQNSDKLHLNLQTLYNKQWKHHKEPINATKSRAANMVQDKGVIEPLKVYNFHVKCVVYSQQMCRESKCQNLYKEKVNNWKRKPTCKWHRQLKISIIWLWMILLWKLSMKTTDKGLFRAYLSKTVQSQTVTEMCSFAPMQ